MKHMLLIYHQEETWKNRTKSERQQTYVEYRQLIDELKSKRKYLFGDQLQPAAPRRPCACATANRWLPTDRSPETREQIGGLFMIEADSLDEATNIAAHIPSAQTGVIEVRPVVQSEVAVPGVIATGSNR
jgi:hypothetical protein